MKKDTVYTLFIIAAILVGCNSEKQSITLKKGYYSLVQTVQKTTNFFHSESDFHSASLYIGDTDSLFFPGSKNIGDYIWGHNKFKYQIEGDEITLYNKGFKETFNIEITKDSLLKLEINNDKFSYISFKYITLKLSDKYQVIGFTQNKTAIKNKINRYVETLFNHVSFNFKTNDTVEIYPPLAQYFLKDSTATDFIFTYNKLEKEIVFISPNQTFKLPYLYDGILHLYINDNHFKQFDLIKAKEQR